MCGAEFGDLRGGRIHRDVGLESPDLDVAERRVLERRPVDESVHLLAVHPLQQAQVDAFPGTALDAGADTRAGTAARAALAGPARHPRHGGHAGRNACWPCRRVTRRTRTAAGAGRPASARQAPARRREGRHAVLEVAVLEERAGWCPQEPAAAQAGQFPVLGADRGEVLEVGRVHGRRRLDAASAAPGGLDLCAAPGGAALVAEHEHPAAAPETTAPGSAEIGHHPDAPRRRVGAFGEVDQIQPCGRGRPPARRDEVVAFAEGQDGRDVAVREDVVQERAGFRLAHHVAAGVGRGVRVLVHEVAVDVDAARAVLVVEAVAVVVDALRVERPAAGLALRRSRPASSAARPRG